MPVQRSRKITARRTPPVERQVRGSNAGNLKGQQSSSEAGERPNTYSSPAILERRRRILEETRNVIADRGIAGVSMNEICKRAGVAKRTLYNAFQTRERMIATAIKEYFDEYLSKIEYDSPPGTMNHNLERMISVVQRNRKIRNYVRAILSLYFSPDVDRDIWDAMHSSAFYNNMQWISGVESRRQLQPWVDVENLLNDLVRFEFATIYDWTQGRIADEEILIRLIVGYLTLVGGAVRGAARTEVEGLLNQIVKRGRDALPQPRRARLNRAA